MNTTLKMIDNLQFDPIKIPDYCLIEFYKDSIDKNSALGFSIISIAGLTIDEIKSAIAEKVSFIVPEGYTDYVILAGRDSEEYNHKKIYVVWYKGEAPTYPAEPEIEEPAQPAEPAAAFEEYEIFNNGGKDTPITIEFTITTFGEDIEFYLNDDFYSITPSLDYGTNVYIANSKGVSYQDIPIDTFKFPSIPYLMSGKNILKVKKTNVSNVNIKYTEEY